MRRVQVDGVSSILDFARRVDDEAFGAPDPQIQVTESYGLCAGCACALALRHVDLRNQDIATARSYWTERPGNQQAVQSSREWAKY